MNVYHRVRRGMVAALFATSALIGSAGSQAAYALPSGPGDDPCVPQTVTASDAVLNGTLRLLDASVVGLESRISMQAASVQLPDPKCDGKSINVPLVYHWDILGRPAGSTAQLTQTTSLTTKLTPDVPGAWQVGFTACPSGCHVTGTLITVPPLRKTIDLNATNGIEGHLTSDFLDSTLKLFLGDSRIQISHTGQGGFVTGAPYEVVSYPEIYQRRCMGTADPPDDCDELLDQVVTHATYHTVTPTFSSFFDFGPTAETLGAPGFIILPVEPHEHDIPTWKRAVFLSLQGFGAVSGLDVDRARLYANNINLDLGKIARWESDVSGGSVNIKMSFESAHPTIKCEAHFTHRIGFIFTVDSGWSDELCPDYDLGQMDMTIHLYPAVQGDTLTLSNATVDVQLEPTGLQSDLIDFFFDVSDEQEVSIAEKVRNRLVTPENRAKLGQVLFKVLQHRFSDLDKVLSSRINDTDWVIRYLPD